MITEASDETKVETGTESAPHDKVFLDQSCPPQVGARSYTQSSAVADLFLREGDRLHHKNSRGTQLPSQLQNLTECSVCVQNSQLLLPSSQGLAATSVFSLDSERRPAGSLGTLGSSSVTAPVTAHAHRSAKLPKPSAPEQPAPHLHLRSGGAPRRSWCCPSQSHLPGTDTTLPSLEPPHLVLPGLFPAFTRKTLAHPTWPG